MCHLPVPKSTVETLLTEAFPHAVTIGLMTVEVEAAMDRLGLELRPALAAADALRVTRGEPEEER